MYYYTGGFRSEAGLETMYERIEPNDGFKRFCKNAFEELSSLKPSEQKEYGINALFRKEDYRPKKVEMIGTLSVSYFKGDFTYQVDAVKIYNPDKVLEKEKEKIFVKQENILDTTIEF